MWVWMASRFFGGVSMTDRSRIPARDSWRVRGMGVALMASTSTFFLNCLIRSFAATPKRCSSSTTSSPRFLNLTSRDRRRWVPMTMSIFPASRSFATARCSAGVRKRLSISTRTGKPASRSRKVLRCCTARTVVGTRIAACFPSMTDLKAARIATSVFPKPTSPQTRRSMGREVSMSDFTSWIAFCWSGVSSKGKEVSNSRCQGVSGPKA